MTWLRLAVLVLSWVPGVCAQTADSGTVTGSVFDAKHDTVPMARVTLQRAGSQEVTTLTDSRGIYRVTIPAGTYSVRVNNREGKAPTGPLVVSSGKLVTVDLVLQPSVLEDLPFSDEPQFTVAGVKDNSYRGGHGSDAVLRSAEVLTQETASLGDAVPAGEDPHRALAAKNERDGHPFEALREFQQAAELSPSEPNYYYWGAELLAHRAPEAAAEIFAKGVRLFPQSVRMMLGLATGFYTAGSYDRAGTWFYKATDLNPSDPEPYLFLGKVQATEITGSSEYEQRMARFAKLHPDYALANYYYAVSVWNKSTGPEDLEASKKARALLEKALTLDPKLGTAYLQLGIVNSMERNYPDAIRDYRKAIEMNPALEQAHYRLSAAYRITGETAKAEEELATYKRQSEQSAEALERQRSEIQQFVVNMKSDPKTAAKPDQN